MVSAGTCAVSLLAQVADPKVPEPTRTIILMALLAILLVGLLLIVGTMLGGHWVRRQGEIRRGPVVPTDVILPRAQQLRRQTLEPDNHSSTGETFVSDDTVGSDDTVVS